MALSASVLSTALQAALADPTICDPDADPADRMTAYCDAIAGAVVAHITANAVVTVLGTGSTLAGVPVPPGGGPVAITLGTANGTIA
jgi:hypothetical protein